MSRQYSVPQDIEKFIGELLAASKLDKVYEAVKSILPEFRYQLEKYSYDEYRIASRMPGAHSVDTLRRMASHPCTIDSLHETVNNLIKFVEEMREKGENEEDIQEGARGYYQAIARTLTHGYDKAVVNEERLQRDKSGRITDILDPRVSSICKKTLMSGEYLGGKKRRKTKKVSHKKRKTLRRPRH